MNVETISAAMLRLRSMKADVAALRDAIDREELAVSDRQYLSRCLDLLDIELGALRDYLGDLA